MSFRCMHDVRDPDCYICHPTITPKDPREYDGIANPGMDRLLEAYDQLKAERDALAAQLAEAHRDLSVHEEICAPYSDLVAARDRIAELERQLADAEMCARGSADLVCTQREVIAILERKLADATELIERMTGGAVRRAPEDSEIARER